MTGAFGFAWRSLVRQPAWIAPDGVEIMSLHLDDPTLARDPDAEVEVTIHSSVTSRTEFNRAVSGEELGGTRSRLTFPLSDVQRNGRGQFLIGFGLSGSDAQPQVGIDSPGVYPVEVGVIGRAYFNWDTNLFNNANAQEDTYEVLVAGVTYDRNAGIIGVQGSAIWSFDFFNKFDDENSTMYTGVDVLDPFE